MTTILKKQCGTLLLLSFLINTQAQVRSQDYNSSASNKTASSAKPDDWTFGMSSGPSFAAQSNEGSLFRGNSIATKLYSRYHFGNIGLGFSGGNVPGTINRDALNAFMADRKFQQAEASKSNPSNSYLLFGPSFRFGNRVMVLADIQGGMFINNPGSVSIAQAGVVRQLYRFEGSGKNVYPGFSGNISLAYPINNSTRFVFNTDYLHSKSSVRLYDPQQGIDVPADQERRVKLFAVGVGITKSFGRNRDAGSGMATGKRQAAYVTNGNPVITERQAQDQRIISTTQRHAINTKGNAATNDRIINSENCGPVTLTTTNPDGSIEELSFACPADAAMYNDRMNKNVTVPKQTQGSTFGEKVNQGLHAAGSALSQGARGVISGNVSWSSKNSSGIITNENVVSSVGALGTSGGGAASASYAATGRMVSSSTTPKGIVTAIYVRETGSGMATGKRSARDNGSGIATGKRQYTPVFNEGEPDTCTGCAASVKLIAHEAAHVVQQTPPQLKNNPLYNGNSNQGTNPLFEGKGNLRTGGDDDCDGVAGLAVYLIDINNGAVVANTKTATCGDFFFANVPIGAYRVKVTGGVSTTKTYEARIDNEGKLDMAGEIMAGDDHWVIQLNTETNNTQKAGVSTSRSNIRTRSINIIETDPNSTGAFEPAKIIMEFTDGSFMDVTAFSKTTSTNGGKKVVVRGWDPKKKEEYAITIADGDGGTIVSNQQENGTKKEVRIVSKTSYHSNVIQRIIPVDDTNADAAVIKTKTKSNQSNDRVANTMMDGNGSSRSYIKTLPGFIGDIDGDGVSEILTGSSFVSSNSIGQGASLLGGALPGGAVISALVMPGNPIGGIIVKGGKNPGGSFLTTQTNEYGEFEFTDMAKGTYAISAEVRYYLDDETIVTVEDNEEEGATDRKGWDGTVKGSSKNEVEDVSASVKKSSVQNPDLFRANKTTGVVDNTMEDGTVAKSIVNTTKSNTKDFLVALDSLDRLLAADKSAPASVLRTAKENSRLVRSSYQTVYNALQNGDLVKVANEADTDFAVLLGSVNKLGQRYNSISNVLKTKHDTAKNSVSNIR